MHKLINKGTSTAKLSPEIPLLFQKIKNEQAIRAIIFKLTDDESEIVIAGTLNINEDYSNFISQFPDNDIRWAVLDFPYRTTNGGERSKLTLITWVPDTLVRENHKETARVKSNGVMMVGPFHELEGIQCKYQANDYDSLDRKNVLSKVAKFERDTIDRGSIDQLLPHQGFTV